jgi:hypothetical protein
VADEQQGLASGIVQTAFQIGGAVVLAVVTAVVDARGGNKVVPAATLLSAYRPALVVITGVAAIGVVVAVSGLASRQERRAGNPVPVLAFAEGEERLAAGQERAVVAAEEDERSPAS